MLDEDEFYPPPAQENAQPLDPPLDNLPFAVTLEGDL